VSTPTSTCGRHSIIPQRFRYLHLFIHTPPPPAPALHVSVLSDGYQGDEVGAERTSLFSRYVRHSQEIPRRLLRRALPFANGAVALRLRWYTAAATWTGCGRRV
jgi:hypothetical protein